MVYADMVNKGGSIAVSALWVNGNGALNWLRTGLCENVANAWSTKWFDHIAFLSYVDSSLWTMSVLQLLEKKLLYYHFHVQSFGFLNSMKK